MVKCSIFPLLIGNIKSFIPKNELFLKGDRGVRVITKPHFYGRLQESKWKRKRRERKRGREVRRRSRGSGGGWGGVQREQKEHMQLRKRNQKATHLPAGALDMR